jgi:hypothetical protein
LMASLFHYEILSPHTACPKGERVSSRNLRPVVKPYNCGEREIGGHL